jgi:hypothetical protein
MKSKIPALAQTKPYDGKLAQILKKINNSNSLATGISTIKSFQRNEIGKYCREFLQHSELQKLYKTLLFPRTLEDMCVGNVPNVISVEKELLWYAYILKHFKTELVNFVALKEQFEEYQLLGNYEKSIEILDTIFKKFGYSFWLFENNFNLRYDLRTESEAGAYIESIYNNPNIDVITRFFTRLTHLRRDISHTAHSFERLVKERTNNQKLNDYLHFRLCILGSEEVTKFEHILLYEGNSSLIDRYLTFVTVCKSILSNPKFNALVPSVRSALNILGDIEGENNLTNTLRYLGSSPNLGINESQTELKNILDLYCEGRHKEIAETIKNNRSTLKPKGEHLVLYATSIARLPEVERAKYLVENSFFDKIICNLVAITLREPNLVEASNYIRKIAISYSSTTWSTFLVSFLELNRRTIDSKFANANKKFCFFSLSPINPRIALLFDDAADSIEFLTTLATTFGNSSSLSFYKTVIFHVTDTPFLSHKFPSEKVMLYRARKFLENGDHKNAALLFSDLLTSSDLVVKYESCDGAARSLIWQNQIEKAAEISANAYIENPRLLDSLPFQLLYERIENLTFSEIGKNLAVSICLDGFSKVNKKNIERLQYSAYEDFLSSQEVDRPSQLIKKTSHLPPQLQHFIMDICIPRIMDSSTVFKSTKEIEDERILICQQIMQLNPNLSADCATEISAIKKNQYLRERKAEVEQSKIYVNIEGLKKQATSDLGDLYQVYQFLQREETFDHLVKQIMKQIRTSSPSEKLSIFIPPAARFSVLLQLVEAVRNEFVSSSSFGLDGYLSVRIRHGILAGHIRASLEGEKLITRKNEHNLYDNNEHWGARLEDAIVEMSGFHKEMSNFSAKIDGVIENLKSKIIQVRSSIHTEGFFNFEIKRSDLVEIEKKLSHETSFSEFLDVVFDLLWRITEENLGHIRSYIEKEVKVEIDRCFLDLLGYANIEMGKLPNDTSLKEFEVSVKKARTQMSVDLDRIIAWFVMPRESAVSDYELQDPFEVASETVKLIHPNLKLNFAAPNEAKLRMIGETFKPFCDISNILFENIATHAGLADNSINVALKVERIGDAITLSLKNNVSNECLQKVESIIRDLEKRLNSSENFDRVRTEGGSGLFKIRKMLKVDLNSEPTFKLSLLKAEREFIFQATFKGTEMLSEYSHH